MGDKVNVVLSGKFDKFDVFFAYRGKVWTDTWSIDAFLVFDLSTVTNAADQIFIGLFNNLKRKVAIVNQDLISHGNFLMDIQIANIDDFLI